MSSPSPLATICHVIQQVRTNAHANPNLFQNNEAATRAALIDPILRALGWDTTNVQMIEPERMVANKQKLDYVLKDSQGKVRSVVEAKKLGESLDKIGHVGAVIGYAFSLHPKSFFITDGLNWHHYSPAHSSYQPIETIDLNTGNPSEVALQLIQWLDAAQSGYDVQQTPAPGKNGLSMPESSLPAPLPHASKSIKKVIKQLLNPAQQLLNAFEFIEVANLHLLNLLPGQKPKQLRLPNGSVTPINNWKDILLEVCQLVLQTNPHLPIPFPDKAGKKRSLISGEKQPIGSSTKAAYKNKSVFIGTNYSKEDCIANANYAVQQLPASQQKMSLAVAF